LVFSSSQEERRFFWRVIDICNSKAFMISRRRNGINTQTEDEKTKKVKTRVSSSSLMPLEIALVNN